MWQASVPLNYGASELMGRYCTKDTPITASANDLIIASPDMPATSRPLCTYSSYNVGLRRAGAMYQQHARGGVLNCSPGSMRCVTIAHRSPCQSFDNGGLNGGISRLLTDLKRQMTRKRVAVLRIPESWRLIYGPATLRKRLLT